MTTMTTLTDLTIQADYQQLTLVSPWVMAFVEQTLEQAEGRTVLAADLALAVHEVAANQIDHAYRKAQASDEAALSGGQIVLSLTYDPQHSAIIARTKDWGLALQLQALPHTCWRNTPQGQQLISVEEPTWDQVRGRGLFLIHSLTNNVLYQSTPDFNAWTLTKLVRLGQTNH